MLRAKRFDGSTYALLTSAPMLLCTQTTKMTEVATAGATGTTFTPWEYRGLLRSSKVPPCVLSNDDLQRLYRDLRARASEAIERHIAALTKPADVDEEKFAELKDTLRKAATLNASIIGKRGEQIVSESIDALAPTNLPDDVTQIEFDSAFPLRTFNILPLNRFRVVLDFTEPPPFHAYNPWDDPTPNASIVEVIGNDNTWVTAFYESTLQFFRGKRGRKRAWFHNQIAFSVLNWFIGLPAGLWCAYRLDSQFLLALLSPSQQALRVAVDVYVFLLITLLFRVVLYGFRWIFRSWN